MAKLRSLAKRQHYHMSSILKSFAPSNELVVIDKETKKESFATTNDDRFLGLQTWSNKIEEVIGRDDIERKMQGQIRHIHNKGNVSDHAAVSRYDLFWKIRHFHALNPSEPEILLEGMRGDKLPEDLVHWSNQHDRVPVQGDGTINGMFCATMKIEHELENNSHQYNSVRWDVYYCPSGGFISADCYQKAVIPLSDTTLLAAVPKHHAAKGCIEVARDTVEEFNAMALEQCHAFCFKLKIE